MHRILLRTVVFDFPGDVHDAGRDFWATALDAGVRRGRTHAEYHALEHPAAVGPVLVQHLGAGPSRVHVDVESDDTGAEVSRLVAAGATVVERFDDWTVPADPGGLPFCVVPARLDEDFARDARTVGG
jgi:hypothetical protein